jgi:hypothetical protein
MIKPHPECEVAPNATEMCKGKSYPLFLASLSFFNLFSHLYLCCLFYLFNYLIEQVDWSYLHLRPNPHPLGTVYDFPAKYFASLMFGPQYIAYPQVFSLAFLTFAVVLMLFYFILFVLFFVFFTFFSLFLFSFFPYRYRYNHTLTCMHLVGRSSLIAMLLTFLA